MRTKQQPTPVNLKVLDLSHWDSGPRGGPIDFGAMLTFGIKGVILKATQGANMADPTYATRRLAAKAAGMLVGAYAFNTGDSVIAQVNNFMRVAQPDDDMLCALDFEDYFNPMTLSSACHFLESVDNLIKRPCWLYSGNRIKAHITHATADQRQLLSERPLWLAQYGPVIRLIDVDGHPLPWKRATLWQFSGDGINSHGIKVPGVSTHDATTLDMNSYDGHDDQLAAEWKGVVPVA